MTRKWWQPSCLRKNHHFNFTLVLAWNKTHLAPMIFGILFPFLLICLKGNLFDVIIGQISIGIWHSSVSGQKAHQTYCSDELSVKFNMITSPEKNMFYVSNILSPDQTNHICSLHSTFSNSLSCNKELDGRIGNANHRAKLLSNLCSHLPPIYLCEKAETLKLYSFHLCCVRKYSWSHAGPVYHQWALWEKTAHWPWRLCGHYWAQLVASLSCLKPYSIIAWGTEEG